jgi:hypothetical protein
VGEVRGARRFLDGKGDTHAHCDQKTNIVDAPLDGPGTGVNHSPVAVSLRQEKCQNKGA